MRIKELHLTDVRNIARCDMTPSPGVNFLYGDNGQGKTNLVEAVYFLATLDFHRGRSSDFIRHGAPKAVVASSVELHDLNRRIEITVEGKRSSIVVDGDRVKRFGNYIGRFLAVAFFPEDMQILLQEPALRRRWLNTMLSVHTVSYHDTVNQARKALENRNRLLREPDEPDKSLMDSIDSILSTLGAEIIVQRRDIIEDLDHRLRERYKTDFAGSGEPSLIYIPSFKQALSGGAVEVAEAYRNALAEGRERDFNAGLTLVGPHRDDFSLVLDGQPVRTTASRGEVRTALFSLNLAKMDILREKYDQEPVIILDDVLSELDSARRQKVLQSLPDGCQVFITSTDKEMNIPDVGQTVVYWQVKEGGIRKDEG